MVSMKIIRFTNCTSYAILKHVKEPIRKEALNMGLNILLAGLAVLLVVVGIVSKVTDK